MEKLNFKIVVVGDESARPVYNQLAERVKYVQFLPAEDTPSLVTVFTEARKQERMAEAGETGKQSRETLEKILAKNAEWAAGIPTGQRANLSGMDLSGRDLSRKNLSGADCRGTNFTGAIMTSTNLEKADCRGAIFTGANLRGANFKDAAVDGAAFWDCKNLSKTEDVPDWALEQAKKKPPKEAQAEAPEQPPQLSHMIVCMEGDSYYWSDGHFFQIGRYGSLILYGSGIQFERLKKGRKLQMAESVKDILNILTPGGGRELPKPQPETRKEPEEEKPGGTPEETPDETTEETVQQEISPAPEPAPAAPAEPEPSPAVPESAPASPTPAEPVPEQAEFSRLGYNTHIREYKAEALESGQKPTCSDPIRIDVCGMGGRSGCTTQAVALWHYCESIGLHTAILGEKSMQKELGGTDAADGFTVAGVRYVTHENGSYNCYINDVSKNGKFFGGDILLAIAGIKPWEWKATTKWMQDDSKKIQEQYPNTKIAILVSYATEDTYQDVEAYFHRYPHAAVTYQHSDTWDVPDEALATIDRLLREPIQAVCAEKAAKREVAEDV